MEQEKLAKGQKPFIPEAKPKPPKRNIPKERRQRMKSYGDKVMKREPLNVAFKVGKP